MDALFRNAIAISALIHSALFAPFLRLDTAKSDPAPKKPIEVDYIRVKEPRPEVKIPETPKVDIAKRAEMKPAEAVPAAKPSDNAPKVAPLDDAKKQAAIKSTRDYVNYYTLIREKIRKRLKSNYRTYLNEGEVGLAFTLASDGRLIDVSVAGVAADNDAPLAEVARRSVREASPFPAFPKALSLPQMTFDLTVTFKKR